MKLLEPELSLQRLEQYEHLNGCDVEHFDMCLSTLKIGNTPYWHSHRCQSLADPE